MMKKTMLRMSSLLLATVFTLSLLAVPVLAAEEDAQHSSGCGLVCTHTEHDADCGQEDAVPESVCGHVCGEDEWVCAEDCSVANPAEDETSYDDVDMNSNVALLSDEVIRDRVQVVVKDKDGKYAFNQYVNLRYSGSDPNGLQLAIEADAGVAAAIAELRGTDSAYYISSVRDYASYIYVYTALAGDITATATNGTISYKTTEMEQAASYTEPVANDTGLTFYFTPTEGYELGSAKLDQNNIELTDEGDGSYSHTIDESNLYSALTLAVTFIKKPAVVESLTLDMNNGGVSVEKSGVNLLVIQGNGRYTLTGGTLTLTGTMDWGTQMPKTDLVTIGADVELDLTTDNLTINGNWTRRHIITIGENAAVNWTLQGETTLFGPTASAVKLAAGAVVTLSGDTLIATNNGQDYAAISVPQGAKLTIDGATVTAIGGGAGIGSDTNHYTAGGAGQRNETWAGEINIVGGAHVTAKGGTGAAAIGGGLYSNNGSIRIGAGSVVNATAGGNGPAAIGGGEQATYSANEARGGGMAGTILIEAGATVVAVSGAGSAIGRGLCSNSSIVSDTSGSITIEKGTNVTAFSLGHDNSTGEHGRPYYFAIDAGIENNGDAPILNARFDKGALPQKRITDKSDPENPVRVPQYNNIVVMGGEESIAFALPAEFPTNAFATTVSGAGDYMVANAAEGKTAERAQYLLEGQDSQFVFTVSEGMVTRDQLKFTSYTITATAGDNGSISDAGEVTVSPVADKTYTFTPADGYVVDAVTVDNQTTEVTGNTYTFENVTAHHTISVTFKTAPVTPPVTPPVDPVDPTTYKITVKYVDMNGVELAKEYSTRKTAGSRYDMTEQAAKAIEDYTIDRTEGAVKADTLRGNVTITVYYKAVTGPDQPETEIPEVVPPTVEQPETEIPEEGTPLAPQPEVTPEEPKTDDVIIVDPEVPMGNLPQTGTGRSVDPTVTLGLLALTLSMAAAGFAVALTKKKEH